MRTILYCLTAIVVMALAFNAYQENYATQQTLKDVAKLQRKIADKRERLAILKAEWAYLNRPDRLRELAALNFETLGLMELQPEHFGRADQVSYPQPDLLPILNPVEVSGTQEQQP